ncbi:MAG: hypothetical protein JWR35_207 [Marmoricola sp.]|nr:hypothetical protein [Marmoricola sp.]
MAVAAVVLVVVLLALVGLLLWQLAVLRRRADELAATVAGLIPAAPLAPDLESAFGAGPRRLIVVEILNPLELAANKVRSARLVGGIAPRLVRKIVNEQAVKIVIEKLAEEGVQADVRIHRAS